MKTLLLFLSLAGCAGTSSWTQKDACRLTCVAWARSTGRRGPVLHVADSRTCACIEPDAAGEYAPAYHAEPVAPLMGDAL